MTVPAKKRTGISADIAEVSHQLLSKSQGAAVAVCQLVSVECLWINLSSNVLLPDPGHKQAWLDRVLQRPGASTARDSSQSRSVLLPVFQI